MILSKPYRRGLKFIFVGLAFSGCDYYSGDKIEERVDSGITEMRTETSNTSRKDRDTLNLVYQNAIEIVTDTNIIYNLRKTYTILSNTIEYIDSLKIEIDKLDKNNLNNIKFIKQIFINDKLADTLFNKVVISYELIESIAISSDRKNQIKKSRKELLNEPDTRQRKNQYFGLNNPLGTSMILYGLQLELIQVGILSYKDYITL